MLDDPTAAVDSWVGRHLFNKCVNGALKNKTRVYVTNHLEQAEQADLVAVMEAGRAVEQGSYQHVAETSAVFKELLDAYRADARDHDESKEAAVAADDVVLKETPVRELKRARGRVLIDAG